MGYATHTPSQSRQVPYWRHWFSSGLVHGIVHLEHHPSDSLGRHVEVLRDQMDVVVSVAVTISLPVTAIVKKPVSSTVATQRRPSYPHFPRNHDLRRLNGVTAASQPRLDSAHPLRILALRTLLAAWISWHAWQQSITQTRGFVVGLAAVTKTISSNQTITYSRGT